MQLKTILNRVQKFKSLRTLRVRCVCEGALGGQRRGSRAGGGGCRARQWSAGLFGMLSLWAGVRSARTLRVRGVQAIGIDEIAGEL